MIFFILKVIVISEVCAGEETHSITALFDIEDPVCETIPIYDAAFSSTCNSTVRYNSEETCSTTCAETFESKCSCLVEIGFGELHTR